ncbi:GNAT family N-acetyltransferase [Kineosporia babensis]|uniref:GNAT family N-acetyltransferase n=1 Tax=Kineosporia babensis TaxID=499548 RepID=A0A9X1NL54_9ACTN|nr:GNAT family N-acetyltransferase [Kineosporia babensis]MCD5315544.1 GNAT family N-acetyltransferase [Kineosporia babensis]
MNTPSSSRWAEHVGSRVVIRFRDGEGVRDVLGELLAADEHTLRVQGRRGPVEVRLGSVVAGKPVPPKATRPAPPHLALSVADLELVMAKHWQAAEQDWLGGWLLRASGGYTGRANSVLPVGEPGMPLDVALTEVEDWYTERGLRPRASLPEPRPNDLDGEQLLAAAAVFEGAGWEEITPTSVLTAPVAELRGLQARLGGRPLPEDLEITLADEPDPVWIEQYRYRGQAVPEHGIRLLTSAPRQVFASVKTSAGELVGLGRGSLAEGWSGLTAMKVLPQWRRQGLSLALIGAVAEWSWQHGAMSMYLQVEAGNEPALASYAKAGFVFHHRYRYLAG